MAFAVTSYNVYATETAKAVSPEVTQYIKFTVTAANTDVAYDLATVGGTFWTAAGGSTAGAAVLNTIKKMIPELEMAHPLLCNATMSRLRAASASSSSNYSQTFTAGNICPEIAFNSGDAPTSETIIISAKMKAGWMPVSISG